MEFLLLTNPYATGLRGGTELCLAWEEDGVWMILRGGIERTVLSMKNLQQQQDQTLAKYLESMDWIVGPNYSDLGKRECQGCGREFALPIDYLCPECRQ